MKIKTPSTQAAQLVEKRKSPMIKKTPLFERPRERCLRSSAQCLSLRECIAIILGSGPPGQGALGVADQILKQPGDGLSPTEEAHAFFSALESRGNAYLTSISGLGPAGKSKILAVFEIARRYALSRSTSQKAEQQALSIPELAAHALNRVSPEYRSEPQEWFGFVPLYRSTKLGEKHEE